MYQLRSNFRSNHSDKSIGIAESNEGSGEEEALHNTKLKAHPGGDMKTRAKLLVPFFVSCFLVFALTTQSRLYMAGPLAISCLQALGGQERPACPTT